MSLPAFGEQHHAKAACAKQEKGDKVRPAPRIASTKENK